jgi:hypothetical protein
LRAIVPADKIELTRLDEEDTNETKPVTVSLLLLFHGVPWRLKQIRRINSHLTPHGWSD